MALILYSGLQFFLQYKFCFSLQYKFCYKSCKYETYMVFYRIYNQFMQNHDISLKSDLLDLHNISDLHNVVKMKELLSL